MALCYLLSSFFISFFISPFLSLSLALNSIFYLRIFLYLLWTFRSSFSSFLKNFLCFFANMKRWIFFKERKSRQKETKMFRFKRRGNGFSWFDGYPELWSLSFSLAICLFLSLSVSFLLKMLTFASSSRQVNHQIYLITNTSCYSTLFCAETYITANQFISIYDSVRVRRQRERGKLERTRGEKYSRFDQFLLFLLHVFNESNQDIFLFLSLHFSLSFYEWVYNKYSTHIIGDENNDPPNDSSDDLTHAIKHWGETWEERCLERKKLSSLLYRDFTQSAKLDFLPKKTSPLHVKFLKLQESRLFLDSFVGTVSIVHYWIL